MTLDAWIAVAVVMACFAGLVWGRAQPYLILLAGLTLLMVLDIVSAPAALAGFGNPGLVTIAALFVLVAGLRQTGALALLARSVLGTPEDAHAARMRLIAPVMGASAFLNNTPVVAMLIPIVSDWARTRRFALSQILIPLSYLAILGGLCTMIGTSTNLVVHGLWIESGRDSLGLFAITPLGLICATVGALFLMLVGPVLLPRQRGDASPSHNPREYAVEMVVADKGPLVGKTVEAAGLRHLPQLYLLEINRRGQTLPMVGPDQVLEAGDQLIFVGVVDSVVDLQRIPGLQLATNQIFKLQSDRSARILAEAVVAPECAVAGRTIREGQFRTRYNAAIIAVSRNGERLRERIGDIVLQPGDALLVECLPSFVVGMRNSRDFFLVSQIDGAAPPNQDRAGIALGILAGMVALAGTGVLPMLEAALVAGGLMLLTRCCSQRAALAQIDFPLLITIGAAFGLGRALGDTGAARALAGTLVGLVGDHPWLALGLIALSASILTEFVTNNAAAVIGFPIAIATAAELNADPLPFVMVLMIAASASFATPLGYQTNLMVYGAGRYTMTDFLRVGIPMNLLIVVVATLAAPFIWPF
nr:SLC13 family permease [Oceanococcus sp. HetDA_MAG_MS8]